MLLLKRSMWDEWVLKVFYTWCIEQMGRCIGDECKWTAVKPVTLQTFYVAASVTAYKINFNINNKTSLFLPRHVPGFV